MQIQKSLLSLGKGVFLLSFYYSVQLDWLGVGSKFTLPQAGCLNCMLIVWIILRISINWSHPQPKFPTWVFVIYNLTLLPMFWSQNHFLTGSRAYVYLLDDLSQEDAYLKNMLVVFQEGLGFSYGFGSSSVSLRSIKTIYRNSFPCKGDHQRGEMCYLW